jgi:hypothetical protein
MDERQPHSSPGGFGGRYEDRLERKALVRRWSVPEEKRQQLIDRQIEIAINSESGRESTNAFNAIRAAERDDDVLAGLRPGEKAPDVNVNNDVNVILGGMSLQQKLELLERHRRINAEIIGNGQVDRNGDQ